MEALVIIVSIILMLLPISDWVAVIILRRAARSAPHTIALRERAGVALILALVTTLNATFVIENVLNIDLAPEARVVAISASFIMVGAPNLFWLYLYSRDRLR